MPTSTPEIESLFAKLQAVPMLQGLDATSLAQVARNAVKHTYAPGAVVFLEGDSAPALYYLDSGWVKVVKMSEDGREQILYFMGPGDIFGGVGVFVRRPAPATAIALEAAEIWVLPGDAIRDMLTSNPEMALALLEYLASRIAQLTDMVAALSLQTVTQRLARVLLEQADDDLIYRRRWATQAEMAAHLGTVPEVLNRALRSLVDEQLIEFSRHKIRILDRAGLQAKSTLSR
ncbi:MAG: Crp/Fnr family transcriptional regulator [Caldilineaceae bacterium]